MGVKDLWSVLTPYCERKPICELRGKVVAIDLAGWVCESLNVVDYFVHPRHHLKTCYLIWEEVTPVFVLEGTAPKLKSQVIAKRNEIQFRGVKPKEKGLTQSEPSSQPNADKGRTRFNHVLKQCETLLQAMGIQCVQGPGEAEAYCAFLNKRGLVDGVISQDSDCFAYGASKVYRNFSVSTQGAQAAQGGAVDIYDMTEICKKMDFGQNKIIVMALLCGCDYCPEGIGGVGRDGVLKLFNKYKNSEVLHRIRSWRLENCKYTSLEMKVDDKTICSNCGHMGRTQSHTKSGCGVCRTNRGCDETLWKEERLSLKAELALRKKALADPGFPSEEIIEEFLTEPKSLPSFNLNWKQPNIVKFMKQIGHLLQWSEVYCFQKFFPILTRWQVKNGKYFRPNVSVLAYVVPQEICKKRTVKGIPSLEILWRDEKGFFKGLIPDEQLAAFERDHPKGLQELWCTIEPLNMLQEAFPNLVESFLKSKEKPKKQPKQPKAPNPRKNAKTKQNDRPLSPLDNMSELLSATDEIAKTMKRRAPKKLAQPKKGLQMIDKFLKKNLEKATASTPESPGKDGNIHHNVQFSTPVTKSLPSDLESDADDQPLDISDIINSIVKKPSTISIKSHGGRQLLYESLSHNSNDFPKNHMLDDLDLLKEKHNLSKKSHALQSSFKKQSMDDSFDVLVAKYSNRVQHLMNTSCNFLNSPKSPLSTCNHSSLADDEKENFKNYSYFFQPGPLAGIGSTDDPNDEFEKLMDLNCSKRAINKSSASSDDCIILEDSD